MTHATWCRQMIRMTWGNDKYLRQINATLLFVVGRFPNLKIQWRLEQEGKKWVVLINNIFYFTHFTGTKTYYKVTILRITFFLHTSPCPGFYGQSWDARRSHGLWKLMMTWLTMSGRLAVLSMHWRVRRRGWTWSHAPPKLSESLGRRQERG